MDEQQKAPASLRIAAIATMTALVVVIGQVRFPIPATQGVFTLADVAILWTAFTLGPWSGAVAGGLGAAIFDIISGYAQYSPTSLVVHGLEGLVAGLIALAARGRLTVVFWAIAGIAATGIVAGGYLLAETLFYGGFSKAVFEVLPNCAQGAAGAIGGALLTVAIRRAYPPVQRLRW
jgi:uncharacterized membrane protein